MARIGVIGGSGLYDLEEGVEKIRKVSVKTPFGRPSDKLLLCRIADKEVAFLPRHGIGHRISPSEINYRANIWAMKKLDVERIISITACGSLKEEIRPLDFVIIDQFIDQTNQARKMSFFEKGIIAHISFAYPVCADLASELFQAGSKHLLKEHRIFPKGTYINTEGPAFSTFAESNLYRSWGVDVIGMTNLAEAKLAREAGICYASLAAVTDYDCWHPQHHKVTVEMIISNLYKNIGNAKKILIETISALPAERKCNCQFALKDAIITDKKLMPRKIKKKLKLILSC